MAIVTAAWKRYDLFKLFCEYHKGLKIDGLEIEVFAAVSEKETAKIAANADCLGIHTPNNPLGNKFNQASLAAKAWGADAALVMGSDNFIGPRLLKYLAGQVKQGQLMTGTLDGYIYSTALNRLALNAGYINHRRGEILGAYKMLSAKWLNKVQWMPWDCRISSSLDHSLMQRFKKTERSRFQSVKAIDAGYFCVGIKTGNDMNQFGKGKGNIKISIVPNRNFEKRMPELWKSIQELGKGKVHG